MNGAATATKAVSAALATDGSWEFTFRGTRLDSGVYYLLCIDIDGALNFYGFGDAGASTQTSPPSPRVYASPVDSFPTISVSTGRALPIRCGDCVAATLIYIASTCDRSEATGNIAAVATTNTQSG